ncbi:hypothetical protein HMN09_01095700 [Mycena chlorophos]|uniref:Uncharacterized protein n=1 Tax=Mycena chlorophos TaxID=658473 RepID=A0A8H6VW72_MYCCL|nr:hypothetical protein HMN09_01095700 [Mycena chlorophos]
MSTTSLHHSQTRHIKSACSTSLVKQKNLHSLKSKPQITMRSPAAQDTQQPRLLGPGRPALNRLPSRERARLIHSSHKVGALLGETPHLSLTPSRPSLARTRTWSSDSVQRLVEQPRCRRPVLVVRLPSYGPVEAANSAVSTPTGELASEPCTGTGTQLRRTRSMKKLARTLGENVPPHLVSTTPPVPSLGCAASPAGSDSTSTSTLSSESTTTGD